MNFEETCIQYCLDLQTNGTVIEANLVGVNEVSKISKAKVSVLLSNGEVGEKYIIIYYDGDNLIWKYTNPKDRAEVGFEAGEWAYPSYAKRIVAPIALIMDDVGIKMYGWFSLNELPIYKVNDTTIHLYCNTILPEHQTIVDSYQGVITIEDRPV